MNGERGTVSPRVQFRAPKSYLILHTWKPAAPEHVNAQRLCSIVERAGIRSAGWSGGSALASYVTRSRSPHPAACGFSCLSSEEHEVFPGDLIGLVFVGYVSCSQCTNPR